MIGYQFLAFLRKSLVSLFFCCLPYSVFSQSNIPVEQLVFEPVPLTEAESRPGPVYGAPGSQQDASPSAQTSPADSPRGQRSRLDMIYEIEQYLASAEENESEEGPFSNELKENVIALGQLYQEQGDHAKAIEYLQRGHNIVRVNSGLNSLEQVPVLKAIVPSYIAEQQYKQADETMELILEINKSNYGDGSVGIVPAMEELGDWNVQAFLDRSNILTNINRIDAQRFLMDPNNYVQPVDDPRTSPLFKLYQSVGNYLTAISIIIENQQFTHPSLLGLERKLIKTFFLSTHRENILYEPDFYLTRKKRKTGSRLNTNQIELMTSEDYDRGQKSLERSIAYLAANPNADPHALANAMLEDADWDMLFGRKVKAANKYAEVYEYFRANPDMEVLLEDLIYPDVPQVLPVFMPAPNSREKMGYGEDEPLDYIGHYDVSFTVDRYGKAKRIKILDSEGAVTRNMQIRLNQYLRNVQFRPRFSDAKPDQGSISLRYLIAY